jgi:hypothetical protein
MTTATIALASASGLTVQTNVNRRAGALLAEGGSAVDGNALLGEHTRGENVVPMPRSKRSREPGDNL